MATAIHSARQTTPFLPSFLPEWESNSFHVLISAGKTHIAISNDYTYETLTAKIEGISRYLTSSAAVDKDVLVDDTIELCMLTSGHDCKTLSVIGVLVSKLQIVVARLPIHISSTLIFLDRQLCPQKDHISFFHSTSNHDRLIHHSNPWNDCMPVRQ